MQALGVDLSTIQSIVGHADVDMTQHYLHVQDGIRQEAIRKFAQAFPLDDIPPEDPETGTCRVIRFPHVGWYNSRNSTQTQSIKGQMCVKRVPQKNWKSSAPVERNFFGTKYGKNKEKSFEIRRFRSFLGGDKRDRTADLLNAIGR